MGYVLFGINICDLKGCSSGYGFFWILFPRSGRLFADRKLRKTDHSSVTYSFGFIALGNTLNPFLLCHRSQIVTSAQWLGSPSATSLYVPLSSESENQHRVEVTLLLVRSAGLVQVVTNPSPWQYLKKGFIQLR